MSDNIDISDLMTNFCIASRELYNNFFRVTEPYENDGWSAERRYADIETLLFQKMVTDACALQPVAYGEPNEGLRVWTRSNLKVPTMINRDIDGAYWDFPVREISSDATMLFIRFFDWDQLASKDNQYVRVLIAQWNACKEAEGKHALIERRHVRIERVVNRR